MIRNMTKGTLYKNHSYTNAYNEAINKYQPIGEIEIFVYTSTGSTQTMNEVVSIQSTHIGLTHDKSVSVSDKVLVENVLYKVDFITETRRMRVLSLEVDNGIV